MSYLSLKTYYESCLAAHGATPEGVDWPNMDDLRTRFNVMTDWMDWERNAPLDILDVGCGPGFYLDYLNDTRAPAQFHYYGIDISPDMVAAAKRRHPLADVTSVDLIQTPPEQNSVDYAIFNGVFTVRGIMSEAEMTAFAMALLSAVLPACRKGMAVNFMAPHADWYKDTLFYLGFDEAARLFKTHLTRHFSFRSDYGLWEYTAYIHKTPQ